MQAGLQSREPDHRDGFIHDLWRPGWGQGRRPGLADRAPPMQDRHAEGRPPPSAAEVVARSLKFEPRDATLREPDLRHPTRLPRVADLPRHRTAVQGRDRERTRNPCQTRSQRLPRRRGTPRRDPRRARLLPLRRPLRDKRHRKVWAPAPPRGGRGASARFVGVALPCAYPPRPAFRCMEARSPSRRPS